MMAVIEVMLIMLLILQQTQAQHEEEEEEKQAIAAAAAHGYYYRTYMPWLYAMPWRPLLVPRAAPTIAPIPNVSQLSPGYTGPQTFPQARNQQQAPSVPVHQDFGLFMPHPLATHSPGPTHDHFTLPFRPSPFVGYSDDDDNENYINHDQRQHQQEPPFHAPGHKPIQEEQHDQKRTQFHPHYVYMSPSYLYNLVKN